MVEAHGPDWQNRRAEEGGSGTYDGIVGPQFQCQVG